MTRIGSIVYYTEDKSAIRYELDYHYLFGKLISIEQKDKLQKDTRSYNPLQIFFAKIEGLFLYDRWTYIGYPKKDLMLVNLFNNMLIR